MKRVTATQRLQRILNVLPWIVEHQGSTVDEICARFGLERRELLEDLDFVFYNVGLHPFTPDMLADVVFDDDRVTVHMGEYFRRPLRLTAEEALSLLAAGRAVSARPGADPDGTLSRAVDKLAAVLGDDGQALSVSLGAADGEVLSTVEQAVRGRRRVRIDYFSYARDDHSTREVDPYRVAANDGHWYLLGWCHRAEGERVFRVDRISSAEILDGTFEVPEGAEIGSLDLSGATRSIEIVAPRSAQWVAQTYPTEECEALDDARIRLVLAVSADAWLERLLLQLPPSTTATDLSTGESVQPLRAAAARRVLERYGVSDPADPQPSSTDR